MMFRSFVASACVVCCIAAVLSPVEASARSGGLTIGRGVMVQGAVARPGLRPSVLIGRGPVIAAKRAVVPNIHLARRTPVQRFRRVFGARLPRKGIGVFFGSTFDPSYFTGGAGQYPLAQTMADSTPLLGGDGIVLGRRCGSQTVFVPSEAGGERPITVTRCRSE
jgi:hypothetical protein